MRDFVRLILLSTLCAANVLTLGSEAFAAPASPFTTVRPTYAEPDATALVVARKVATLLVVEHDMLDALAPTGFEESLGKISQNSPIRPEVVTLQRTEKAKFIDALRQMHNSSISAALVEAEARALARRFSAEDLQTILTFLRSGAGRKFWATAGSAFTDPEVKIAGQAYMKHVNDLAAKFLAEYQQQHDALIKAHPEWSDEDAARRAEQRRLYDDDVKAGRIIPVAPLVAPPPLPIKRN